MRRNNYIIRFALIALFVSLYFVLSRFLSIDINNLFKLSFTGVIIIYVSAFFNFYDAFIIVLLGELLSQAFSQYGLTITTPLWLIPPLLRIIPIGITRLIYKKKGTMLLSEKTFVNFLFFYLASLLGALLTTAGNTLVIYLDAKIFNYPDNLTLAIIGMRFLTSILNWVICTSLVIPLFFATRKLIYQIYN